MNFNTELEYMNKIKILEKNFNTYKLNYFHYMSKISISCFSPNFSVISYNFFLREGEKRISVKHDSYFKKFLLLIAGKQILKQNER